MILNQQNYYEILEISEDATLQEIERAYLNAKKTYSSESSALYSMFSKEEAMELHKLIEEAYNTLSNNDLRKAYDSQNVGLSFDDEDLIKESPEIAPNSDLLNKSSDLKMKNGVIPGAYKTDESIEEQIEKLQDCSGSFLQKIRTYKNISLDDVSHFSKISKTNILAIENEDFESLPAKVFVRGFVIQVCKLLNIDSIKFAKEYMSNFDEKRK